MTNGINIENAIKIKGWMSVNELKWLAIHATQAKSIVEVGCFHGRSTRALIDNCPGLVFAVDTWAPEYIKNDGTPLMKIGNPVMDAFISNMQSVSGKALLAILQKTLTQALEDIVAKVEMVFLDGDHRYENVVEDIEAAKKILTPGGLLCGHDYNHRDWPGVKKAVDEYFPKFLMGPDSIWWTRV